ncbi:sensor histidine kinase [Pedobacter sp. R20-19]|uniref:sensor histidine kinase n=1 Tax=Pedobacter sp. R20-19 TaxID=1270196 RepID=UPI0004936A77|nr:sensor histidine kinase [Pedobacter sp. R20-19]
MSTNKRKQYTRLHSTQRKAERSKLRFKRIKRLRNIAKQNPFVNVKRFKTGNYPKQLRNRLKAILAPKVFSMLRNTIEMCVFISRIQQEYDKKRGVFISMEQVESIDHDALVVLLSIMIKFQENSINFNGSFPLNRLAKKIVIQSGFIESLYKKSELGQYYLKGRNNKMLTTGWTKVSSDLAESIMEDITPKLFGEKRTLKGLYRVLIELMHNCHNHANPNQIGTKDWWLSINIHDEKVTFSFIDYGIGVFESLRLKEESNIFKKWFNMVSSYLQNNAEILHKILNGEMHQTATNNYFRGNGLPAIMNAYDRNYISSLSIITNDVFVSVENDVYRTMDINFNGTFVYWEINKNTLTHPWIPLI